MIKLQHRTQVLCLIITMMLILPLTLSAQEDEAALPPVLTADLEPTVATDWMLLTYEIVRDENLDAPEASRVYAYVGVALYESVVYGMPDNFSISGQMMGLPLLPYPDEGVNLDLIATANASMSTILHGLFARSDDAIHARIDALRERYIEQQTELWGEEINTISTEFGDEVGQQLLEWVSKDNYGPVKKMVYEMPTDGDFLWVETSPDQPALEPFWGLIRPFGLGYAEVCNRRIRFELSADPTSTFYKQAAEVLRTSDNLTDEQRLIARFWVDTPGITGAPSGHWVMIGVQLVEQLDLPLSRSAEMFILLNTTLADSFISGWSTKYQVNLLRPVTYINRHLRRNWAPYIESPPFPEYPSGHSVASGAAAEVLTTMFGTVAFVDRTPMINGHEQIQREFTSFEHAAYEAAFSRLYGGIHFRAAIEDGLRQGRCVGQSTINNVRLRSIPQGE